jgi:endonuclease/exonuclease/phosphatase family metal-dependent hydrolase
VVGLAWLGAVVGLARAARRRRRPGYATLVVVMAALAGSLVVAPRTTAVSQPVASGQVLTVASVNVQRGSVDPQDLVEQVRRFDLDLLAVIESTDVFRDRLEAAGLAELLPDVAPGRSADVYAVGNVRPRAFREVRGDRPDIAWQLGDGTEVAVFTIHPPSPVGPGRTAAWSRQLGTQSGPVWAPSLLLGDFNATVDHASFRAVLRRGWRDAGLERGAGLAPTYDGLLAGSPGAPMTLDHVLVGPGIAVEVYDVVRLPGSDHRMVVATIRLDEQWTSTP